MNIEWEMSVERIFRFAAGRTVFVGRVQGGPDVIRDCVCEIWVGEAMVSRLRIEGEMLPDGRARKDVRSVSIKGLVDITDAAVDERGCRLVCLKEP